MKKLISTIFAILLISSTLFAVPNGTVITDSMNSFVEQLGINIPNTTSQQNVWADAYIGKVFPSVPPHFGAGVNVAASMLDTSALSTAANELGISSIPSKLPLPVFTADARVGGVFIPFDLGVSFMKTGPLNLKSIAFDFTTLSADIRLALLQQGLIMPNLSIGAGYSKTYGMLKASEGSDIFANIDFNVETITGSVQLSKSVLIATPFVGARVLFSKINNEWSAKASSVYNEVGSYTTEYSLETAQYQAFAGVGLNLLVLQFTPSVAYDIKNDIWAGSFSVRVKL